LRITRQAWVRRLGRAEFDAAIAGTMAQRIGKGEPPGANADFPAGGRTDWSMFRSQGLTPHALACCVSIIFIRSNDSV
jgi:hypothetical protein